MLLWDILIPSSAIHPNPQFFGPALRPVSDRITGCPLLKSGGAKHLIPPFVIPPAHFRPHLLQGAILKLGFRPASLTKCWHAHLEGFSQPSMKENQVFGSGGPNLHCHSPYKK